MKEHPIIFSTEMVKAIIEDRKTQTRRIIMPQPDDSGLHDHTKFPMSLQSELTDWWGTVEENGESKKFNCRYGKPGDILWVRETWNTDGDFIDYKADMWNDIASWAFSPPGWKPSIHMPRKACRIFLEVTNIRVERVQDITEDDAKKEGFREIDDPGAGNQYFAWELFEKYWNKLNEKRGYGWGKNPWVWVVEFKKIEGKLK